MLVAFAVRRLKKRLNMVRNNKFLDACVNGGVDIFKEIKKHRGKKDDLPNTVDGCVGDESISGHFKEVYTDLYNSVPSNVELQEILHSINIDVNMNDLESVDLIDGDLVKQAIGKLKLGKSDSQFMFGSDALIHGSEILSDKLAFIFRTFLVHGFVPLFLLVCTLVPIVKDRLGDKSSSDNYRAIAISSLLLKIFDWIILMLHGNSLDTSDLQFGFQTGSSTLMCTWVASEVISYYIRHKTSVYCCLLDLKKAFDKVKFSILFSKLLDKGMPKLYVRLLIIMYINQSCKVRWNASMSASFSIVNGVRQGAVLSPSLFSLYIDKLLVSLESSGWG